MAPCQVHLSKGRMSLSKGREIWLVTLKEVISREEVRIPRQL